MQQTLSLLRAPSIDDLTKPLKLSLIHGLSIVFLIGKSSSQICVSAQILLM